MPKCSVKIPIVTLRFNILEYYDKFIKKKSGQFRCFRLSLKFIKLCGTIVCLVSNEYSKWLDTVMRSRGLYFKI